MKNVSQTVPPISTRFSPVPEAPRPLLVVATMMGGVGHTGVETHFKAILQNAARMGYRTQLITPYTGSRMVRALFRPLKNRPGETSQVLYRTAQARVVQAQLAAISQNTTGPVVVYAQCPLTAQSALRAAPQGPDWRIVLVVHYNESEATEIVQKGIAKPGGARCRQLERVEKAVLPRVGKIVFVSDYMRRIINARLPEIARVAQETVPNFPPAPSAAAKAGPSGDLIAIGTLEPRKNQAFLLEVLAKVRDRGVKYSLAIVGEGPDRARLEQLCRDYSLEGQVRFLGFRSDAAQLIPEYRVLVHAARLENCPITLLEGLSYGKPLLAGAVGGIPEIYRDGIEGYYWDLEDSAQAADRLIALLGDPTRYAEMAAHALARYQAVFAQLPERWVTLLTETSSSEATP